MWTPTPLINLFWALPRKKKRGQVFSTRFLKIKRAQTDRSTLNANPFTKLKYKTNNSHYFFTFAF